MHLELVLDVEILLTPDAEAFLVLIVNVVEMLSG